MELTTEQKNEIAGLAGKQAQFYEQNRQLGLSPSESLSNVRELYGKKETEKGPTLAGQIVRAVTKPVAQVATSVVPPVRAGLAFLEGRDVSQEDIYRPVVTDYWGEIYSPGGKSLRALEQGVSADGTKLTTVGDVLKEAAKGTLNVAGIGAEIASMAAGGNFAAGAFRGAGPVLQAAGREALIGAAGGAGAGLAEATENAETLGEAAVDVLGSAGAGALGGGILGGAAAAAGRALRPLSSYFRPAANAVEDVGIDAIETVSRGTKSVEDVFLEAQARGFSPQSSRIFADLTATDRKVAAQMLDLAENVSTGKVAKNKLPIDYVGENLQSRLKEIEGLEKAFGKEVETAALALKGQPIDTAPYARSVEELLSEYGIKRNARTGTLNFSDSDFALTKGVQKDISEAFSYALSKKKDAYDVHRIKKTLDTLISPVKIGEGLEGSAKRLVQRLRRVTDDFLDGNFEAYKAANEKFSSVRQPLEEARDVLGEFTASRLSQRVRSLFSNNLGRSDVQNVLGRLDEVASANGIENGANLRNLGLFAEELDSLYGTQAVTGLKGQVQAAVKGVQAVVDGLRDPIRGAGKAAGDVVEFLAKQTPKDRIEFLNALLKGSADIGLIGSVGALTAAGAVGASLLNREEETDAATSENQPTETLTEYVATEPVFEEAVAGTRIPSGFLQAVNDQEYYGETSLRKGDKSLKLIMGITPSAEEDLKKAGKYVQMKTPSDVIRNAANFAELRADFVDGNGGARRDLTKEGPEGLAKLYVQRYVGILPGESRKINGETVTYEKLYSDFLKKLEKYLVQ